MLKWHSAPVLNQRGRDTAAPDGGFVAEPGERRGRLSPIRECRVSAGTDVGLVANASYTGAVAERAAGSSAGAGARIVGGVSIRYADCTMLLDAARDQPAELFNFIRSNIHVLYCLLLYNEPVYKLPTVYPVCTIRRINDAFSDSTTD